MLFFPHLLSLSKRVVRVAVLSVVKQQLDISDIVALLNLGQEKL